MIPRLINWWLGAPIDTKAAVMVIVGPWIALAFVLWHLLPPAH